MSSWSTLSYNHCSLSVFEMNDCSRDTATSSVKRLLFPETTLNSISGEVSNIIIDDDEPCRKRSRLYSLDEPQIITDPLNGSYNSPPFAQYTPNVTQDTMTFQEDYTDTDDGNEKSEVRWKHQSEHCETTSNSNNNNNNNMLYQQCHVCHRSYRPMRDTIDVVVPPCNSLLSYFTPKSKKAISAVETPSAPEKTVQRHDLCAFCDHSICNECLKTCQHCHDQFCLFCCRTEYFNHDERTFCFDCLEVLDKERDSAMQID